MDKQTSFRQIFPQGAENPPVNAQYFTGRSYLAPLTANKALNVPLYNVTFEPGCRNNWHSHTGGQILIVTAGRGYYQERGSAARELLPGDVVEIAPTSSTGTAPPPTAGSRTWPSSATPPLTATRGSSRSTTSPMPPPWPVRSLHPCGSRRRGCR